MKHIKKFNETKKEEKVEDQEILFNAEVLVDKDEKPSFTTDIEDQEKLKKEFDKLSKIKNFESFIDVDIHIDNIDEVEIENDYDTEGYEEEPESHEESEEESQELGCGCCDSCTCGSEEEVEEVNPETEVKVMNMTDFISSIAGQ
jgi:hypothetical protein